MRHEQPAKKRKSAKAKVVDKEPVYTLMIRHELIEVFSTGSFGRLTHRDLDDTTKMIVKDATTRFIPLEMATVDPFPDSDETKRIIFDDRMFKKSVSSLQTADWCTKELHKELKDAYRAFSGSNSGYRNAIRTLVFFFSFSWKFQH